ncbi:MAG: HAMP domain-containing histidine kinase [Bacteroidales bacterium]|nr:HAMP domain-containing histidine kinase [Bacteroidales bacterium]
MNLNYKQRLFLYFAIIFVIFTVGVVLFEQLREKRFKTEILEEKLDACVEIIHTALRNNYQQSALLDSLILLFPENIRVSLIDKQGLVQFDNYINDLSQLKNHADRPEIVQASKNGKGSDIRISVSNNHKYLYYARQFEGKYIRVALPYDISTQQFLKTDKTFLYFIILLLAAMFLLMNIISNRFGKSIRQLRDFASISNKNDIPDFNFPNDELGEIGAKIIENYRQLTESRKQIDLEQEKTRLLKQEMTGNIAHELRTPVTSIRGFLETVLELPLDQEKKKHFITQAYHQTMVLSELIQDMSLITKIEEAPQLFKMEAVNIHQLLKMLKNDLALSLKGKGIVMQWNVPDDLIVNGNQNLLYSIFRNLVDNVIRYAGKDIKIQINKYNEDEDFYYFSFYDTGVGIADETHLDRLFERFYRINEGRTRDSGGSGLGLSIVKNAVAFHKGNITVRNRKEGGLEFLFALKINN